jgi:4-amino-4-deoxy-L-arabinose transferase-like glycosyltransferase
VAIGALLVAPAVWSGYTTVYASNGGLPSAGPQVANTDRAVGGGGVRGGGGPGGSASTGLISYLEANRGSATYLVATTNSNSAASIILASQQPVMSLGGFTGSDPILTVDQFARLVSSGQVRYVLVGGGGGGPQGSGGSAIMSWVRANGTLVPSTTIGETSTSQAQLYDLGGVQASPA